MPTCTTIQLGVSIPGQETPRLNLLFPLYGRTARCRKRADFTRAAKLSIRLIERKVAA
ncbi:hypothetical protein ACWD7Y_04695 [Streptomyces drozdowiczii]